MGRYVHAIWSHCRFIGLVALILLSARSFASEDLGRVVLSKAERGDLPALRESFDHLEKTLLESVDPILDAKIFLQSFVDDVNAQYGRNILLQDVCLYVKTHARSLEVDDDTKNLLIEIIDSVLSCSGEQQCSSVHFYWPWEWNWFGLNTPAKKTRVDASTRPITAHIETLPGQIRAGSVVGALEIIAGGAIGICFGETIIGGVVAAGLVADGLHRIANDGQADLEEAMRKPHRHPNY